MEINDRVKLIKGKHNLSIEDISKELKISKSYIHKLLQGTRSSAYQKQRISDYVSKKEKEIGTGDLKSRVKIACIEREISMKRLSELMECSMSFLYRVIDGKSRSEELEYRLYNWLNEN